MKRCRDISAAYAEKQGMCKSEVSMGLVPSKSNISDMLITFKIW